MFVSQQWGQSPKQFTLLQDFFNIDLHERQCVSCHTLTVLLWFFFFLLNHERVCFFFPHYGNHRVSNLTTAQSERGNQGHALFHWIFKHESDKAFQHGPAFSTMWHIFSFQWKSRYSSENWLSSLTPWRQNRSSAARIGGRSSATHCCGSRGSLGSVHLCSLTLLTD